MLVRSLAALVVAAALSVSASASPINFANTPGGVYSTGIPGSVYTFVGPSSSGATVTGTAGNFPLTFYDASPVGVTTPTSQWILTQANGGGSITDPPGSYTFTTTFTLPANLVSAAISGRFAADDRVTGIVLNGNTFPVGGPGSFGTGFQSFALNSGFQPGLNTLTFNVTNDPNGTDNPVGLNVQVQSALAVVPEPATVAVLGLLAVGGAGYVRRRKIARA